MTHMSSEHCWINYLDRKILLCSFLGYQNWTRLGIPGVPFMYVHLEV